MGEFEDTLQELVDEQERRYQRRLQIRRQAILMKLILFLVVVGGMSLAIYLQGGEVKP